MPYKFYNELSEKYLDKEPLEKENKQRFQKNKYSSEKSQNYSDNSSLMSFVKLDVIRRSNELYSSILDAASVLSEYKKDLSLQTALPGDCITPLTESNNVPMLFYKREDLTSIKAYKIRGALYQMKKLIEENPLKQLKFVAASTGNHALGVLKAAEILKVMDVTICVSECITEFKKQKLKEKIYALCDKGIDARLVISGRNFDETSQFAKELVELDAFSFYIDPYNTHNAVAGQGTIGLEILSQLENKNIDFEKLKELTVVVPIGGGGLISGVSCAMKVGIKKFEKLKNLKISFVGVNLQDLNSCYGDAIKVKNVGEHNSEYINHFVSKRIVIDDFDMKKGIDFVKGDMGVKVEGASAGTLKPILDGIIVPSEKNAVVCILSGGNVLF